MRLWDYWVSIMRPDLNPDVEQSDEDLLSAALNAPEGDLRAFEELIQRHQRRVVANCRYLTRDEAHFEDLAQEVFVKAFFGLRGFEGRSSFRHWLQRIKVNHCLNHLKKNRDSVSIDDESAGSFHELQVRPEVEAALDAAEDRQRIDQILTSMPDTLRVPLVMCDMDELSYEEIANSLGIGLSAAKMRIKRARERFRSLYLEDGARLAGRMTG